MPIINWEDAEYRMTHADGGDEEPVHNQDGARSAYYGLSLYVIQSIGLFPHMNVAENINIVPRLTGSGEDRAAELLDLVALPADMAGRTPRELSGGQQQRVGVARALAARPKLMLMDEPFGALDPVTRDSLGRAYRDLHDRLGLTTLMVTHDIAEALLLADRIVVLIDGRVRADAVPAENRKLPVLSRPKAVGTASVGACPVESDDRWPGPPRTRRCCCGRDCRHTKIVPKW